MAFFTELEQIIYNFVWKHKRTQICHQKVLELINEFSKVAGHKINIQKSVALLYIKNEP